MYIRTNKAWFKTIANDSKRSIKFRWTPHPLPQTHRAAAYRALAHEPQPREPMPKGPQPR